MRDGNAKGLYLTSHLNDQLCLQSISLVLSNESVYAPDAVETDVLSTHLSINTHNSYQVSSNVSTRMNREWKKKTVYSPHHFRICTVLQFVLDAPSFCLLLCAAASLSHSPTAPDETTLHTALRVETRRV